MLVGAAVALLPCGALAFLLARRSGWMHAVAVSGFVWSLAVIALVTLIPPYGAPGVVLAESRLPFCSREIGGPAPEGFGVFGSDQRLLNTLLFVPSGVLLVVAAMRRPAWALLVVPLGLAVPRALLRGHRARPVRAGPDRPGVRSHRLRRQRDRRGHRRPDRPGAGAGAPAVAAPIASPDMGSPQPRPNVSAIPAYVAGRPPTPVPGLRSYKLSSNENPHLPLPGVLEAAVGAAARMNRYPDMGNTELYAALSARFDVPVEDLAVATGSVALIYQLAQAFCEPGDEVVFAWRSFEAYPIGVAAAAATAVQVPVTVGRPARPRRDGGRDHRPDPDGPGLHPQQPDRPGGLSGRARRVPGPGAAARPRRGRRGVRRVRPASTTRSTGWRRTARTRTSW